LLGATNEGGLSGYAGAEPKIGDVIETGLTALDAEMWRADIAGLGLSPEPC
jgi:hypothetical protein